MEDNSWSQIILNDIYNTFYKDEVEADEEIDVAKERKDMALSIMKEKFLSMVEYEKEKAKLMVSDDLSMVEFEKGKAKLMIKYRKDDKGKEIVDDLQNRVERLEGDLARAEKGKAKLMVYEKGKAKADALDDVDLVDAFDLENKIKKLSEDFNRLLKAKKAKEANEADEAGLNVKKEVVEVCSDEEDYSDEGETHNIKSSSTSTRSRAPTASTRSRAPTAFTRSRAPIASISNERVASTALRGYKKIAMTGCVLALRAPSDPNAPPPLSTRKRKP
ncbi:hypothetical protein Tco_0805860 [Tanacetum coccineum]